MKKNFYCISIETTARHLGLALHQNEKLKQRRFTLEPSQQSEKLIPGLQSLLKKARIKKEDLSLISVNVGPGSFTGVRVGVATARTMAQALNIPVVGICSLEAMASQRKVRDGHIIITSLSALPGEIYYAVYQKKDPLKVLVKPKWGTIQEFERETRKFKRQKFVWVKDSPVYPETLGQLAIQKYLKTKQRKKFVFENVVPMYLQPSWAERKKNGPLQRSKSK